MDVTRDDAERALAELEVTGTRVARGRYAWQVARGGRSRSGVLEMRAGDELPGDTPQELGAACLERLVGFALLVEAWRSDGPPPGCTDDEWADAVDASEGLRWVLGEAGYKCLLATE